MSDPIAGLLALIVLVIPLVDSDELDPIPEVYSPVNPITVNPASYANMAALLSANPAVVAGEAHVLFDDGNYTDWGNISIKDIGGTAEARLVFRHVNANVPPWKRSGQAVFEQDQFLVTGSDVEPIGAHHIIFHGLTFSGDGIQFIERAANNIVWSECLHEAGNKANYLRIRLGAQAIKVQRCMFRNPVPVPRRDQTGVQFRLQHHNNLPSYMHDCRVLDCEFINCGDAIQVTDADEDGGYPEYDVAGLLIDGIEAYITEDYHVELETGIYAAAENAIDLKHGSLDPDKPLTIQNSRFWGYRYTDRDSAGSGSNGAIVTNQRYSKDTVFQDNIADDCVIGWFENSWFGGQGESGSRGTKLRRNIWTNIQRHSDHDDINGGVYASPQMPLDIDGDLMINCWQLSATENAGANGDHSITNCIRDKMPIGALLSEWDAGANSGERIIIRYQRKRLSGPEWRTINLGGSNVAIGSQIKHRSVQARFNTRAGKVSF